MRCDPCKIRFLEIPLFLGHLVRCPKWKENKRDVIDYFSILSKKKVVIRKKKTIISPALVNRTPKPSPPTCFTCFCGTSFMSQIRHSAHVQQCLAKVMSKTKTSPVTTPATPTTAKHTVVQLDEDHFKVIIQGSDSIEDTLEEVSFHAEEPESCQGDNEGKDAAEEESRDHPEQEGIKDVETHLEANLHKRVKVEQCEDAEAVSNVTLPDEDVSTLDAVGENDSVTISHEESMEVLEREVMMETETLANPELNETVLRLEYFEEKPKSYLSQQADFANEIEIGNYEDVVDEFVVGDGGQEKEKGESPIRGRLPSIRPPDKTLDIDSTDCDCGKKLRNIDDLTAHLEVCSVYNKKPPQKSSSTRKTIVLITCVCTGKFNKTDIKEHLLHCATWRYVKQKKNLEGAHVQTDESQCEGGYLKSETHEGTPSHPEPDDFFDVEDRRAVSGSEGSEKCDPSQYVVEEIIGTPTVEEDAPSVAGADDNSPSRVNIEIPKVTYKCECGALYRHMNVFKVHQTSCSKCLKSRGQVGEASSSSKPKVAKEDIILKYPASPQGEVLVNRQCHCGLVIDSICAYRNHRANCPLSRATQKKRKIDVVGTPKNLLSSSQKRTSIPKPNDDEAKESADDLSSELKKSKVELCDELKDFVKLPDKQILLRSGRRK